MKILLDENAPIVLKARLSDYGHECSRVQDLGWDGKKNGELLALADLNFDVFVTLDSNLEY
jgi:predicted nuclease of predicted toxin-antitoxin system